MCDASTRQVKFWCVFEFFAPRRRLYGLGFIQLVVTLRSKKDARTSLGFKCFVGTPECLILTRESYNKIRIETREKNTHEKKTHMSSRIIDYSKWDRLKYSSSSEEEEEETTRVKRRWKLRGAEQRWRSSRFVLLRRHLFGTGWCCIIRMFLSRM